MEINVLLAEDEVKTAETVQKGLLHLGINVSIAYDGLIAEKLFLKSDFDAIVLDVNMPGKNGLDVCKSIRNQNKNIPIIFLTAFGELQDKIDGFNAGADDYVVKPFHVEELAIRIKMLLKRSGKAVAENKILVDDLEINLDEKQAYRAGKKINLTAKEFLLLETLAKANGRVLSRNEIAERVWDLDFDTGTNTIDVYINFLRKKIDKGFDTKLIHTRINFGYYLKAE